MFRTKSHGNQSAANQRTSRSNMTHTHQPLSWRYASYSKWVRDNLIHKFIPNMPAHM